MTSVGRPTECLKFLSAEWTYKEEKKLKTMRLRYVLLVGLVLNTPSASVDLKLGVSNPSLEVN